LSQGTSSAVDEPPAAGCEALAAEYDWSRSEFGPRERWEPAVEAVVRTLLEATAPMAYCHGPGYAMLYNDMFAELLGPGHPDAWGQPAALSMPESWSRPGYATSVDNVFTGGPSFHDEAPRDLGGRHHPRAGWTYLSSSYSAVRNSDGSVLGVLIVVTQIAPVLVLHSGADQGDQGAARWRGAELWDQTAARHPLVWSGFRASARRTPERAGNGEFYDVFETGDGRIAVTLGEVRGAGNAAAAVRAQVKLGLRAAALTSSDPNAIFDALDELVSHLDASGPALRGQGETADFGGKLVVTALLGVFDPTTGDLALASAGHTAPAIVAGPRTSGASGMPAPVAEYAPVRPGPPLGKYGTRPIIPIALCQGDVLVAFTHGLIARREHGRTQGQSALLRILRTMSATAARSISQHIVDTLIADKGPEHDCSVLVVVRQRRAHTMISVLVPPEAIAVRGVRQWARGQMATWDLDDETIASAVMGVSELVTNVMQHAGTAARVTMELADRLLVTVEDTGTWSAPHSGRQDLSSSQGRGLALVAAVSDAMGHTSRLDGSTVWFEIEPPAISRKTDRANEIYPHHD
jgi:anti-sigma regulatory factor (Ser/Thr protein kinase)